MASTIRRSKKYDLNTRNLTILTAVIVVVAGGVAALPLITDQYINFGAVCWIAETEEGRPRIPGILYRFLGHYCIIWACNIYIFFSYRSVLKYLSLLRVEKRKARESRSSFQLSEENMQIKKTVHLLMYYPCKQVFLLVCICLPVYVRICAYYLNFLPSCLLAVIVFGVWAPLTGLRLYQAIRNNQDVPIEVIGTFEAILGFQGTMFAIVFSQVSRVIMEAKHDLLLTFILLINLFSTAP
jgi:hypothetical protein